MMLKALAKINLYLEAYEKKSEYHMLDSLVCFAEDFYDEISIEPSEKDSFSSDCFLDVKNNSLVKALDLFKAHFRIKDCFKIHLKKNIWIGAGLGGGSSDAATLFRYLLDKYDIALSDEESTKYLLELGSDMPVCFNQNMGYFKGQGSLVERAQMKGEVYILLAKPEVSLNSGHVFKKDPLLFTKVEEHPKNFGSVVELAGYLRSRKNVLYPNAIKILPELEDLVRLLQDLADNLYVSMSGSGSTCFALFAEKEQARKAALRLYMKNEELLIKVSKII